MKIPYVTLHIKERANLFSDNGFEDVTDAELKTLLQKSRNTVILFEAEFERR